MSWLYGKRDSSASDNASDDDTDDKRPRSNESTYEYVEKRGQGDWVVLQKGTGVVLSHHNSKREAEASFRAMEANKHA
jgi:hypothetical protein